MTKKLAAKRTSKKPAVQLCQWFLRCGRPATGLTPHPVLIQVPTCDRCHKFATELRKEQ